MIQLTAVPLAAKFEELTRKLSPRDVLRIQEGDISDRERRESSLLDEAVRVWKEMHGQS